MPGTAAFAGNRLATVLNVFARQRLTFALEHFHAGRVRLGKHANTITGRSPDLDGDALGLRERFAIVSRVVKVAAHRAYLARRH